MDTVFLVCAILGATLLACEIVAGMLGFGHDHDMDTGGDADADHGDGHGHGNSLFGMLTVRTVTAAVLFFGLGGLTARYYGLEETSAFGLALGAGALALYLVGTARIDRAVGTTGTVYLRVPGARGGSGKVHLMLQNRTVECLAVTAGDELPTGRPIKVVAVVNSDTVEVEAA
ncbi:MAG: hypothetical protein J0I06_02835 [Planctomycetes bacterium]|nr:hypothetical protein [Planctomycetota bacterium]